MFAASCSRHAAAATSLVPAAERVVPSAESSEASFRRVSGVVLDIVFSVFLHYLRVCWMVYA